MILIIYAHPETEGHCSFILKRVLSNLKKKNLEHDVIDLYKLKYDPILSSSEHYTSGNKEISKQNKEFQKKISESDKIIFIYPIWWNCVPAILKGFFDRVLTPGFAYRFNKRGFPEGLLKGKKAVMFITHGGPDVFTSVILRDRGAKIVAKDTLGFCGVKTKFFKIGNAKRLDDKQKKKIVGVVRKGMVWLDC